MVAAEAALVLLYHFLPPRDLVVVVVVEAVAVAVVVKSPTCHLAVVVADFLLKPTAVVVAI